MKFKTPKVLNTDYVFGGITKLGDTPINPTGDWRPYLPTTQTQLVNGVDTEACPNYAYRNAIAILSNFQKKEWYGSARELTVASGTSPTEGNDPNVVGETVRKQGIALETDWPFDISVQNVSAFYALLPKTVKDAALKFLQKFGFLHDWVADKDIDQALKSSPLGVAVSAWYADKDGNYFFPEGIAHNHFTCLVYRDSQFDYIFDSADPFLKKIKRPVDYIYIKRIQLTPPVAVIQWNLLDVMKKLLNLFTAWLTKDQNVGVKITPDQVLPPQASSVASSTPLVANPISSMTKIERWALGIQIAEGWSDNPMTRSWRNENPGNMKYSSLTASLGATGKDSDNFCIFPNYQTGHNALCQFLTLAAKDMLKDYHSSRTLDKFTSIYAHPQSGAYVEKVAQTIGCSTTTDISSLLT